jgi:hypothetical protein
VFGQADGPWEWRRQFAAMASYFLSDALDMAGEARVPLQIAVGG